MIKILSLSGSPVKESSTDILLSEIVRSIISHLGPTIPLELTTIKINDLNFTPCQACGKAPTPKWCFYEDDLTNIYKLIAESDCILFGSPVYFDSVSGQAKMLIDRCNCFRPYDFDDTGAEFNFIKLLERKRPGAIVVVGGDEIGIEQARRTIAGYFKWIEVVNQGVIKYCSPDDRKSGTVRDDQETLFQAQEVGEKISQILKQENDRPKTTDYYRVRAKEYEQIYYRDNPERRQEIADEVVRLKQLVNGKKVLELACGTGYWTQVMSETAAHITALDIWPEMIDEAQKKTFNGPVKFKVMDMFKGQLPANSFDRVAVGFWFSHQPKQEYEKFFDLISKPLHEDGLIWLIDNNPPAEGGKGHDWISRDEFGNNFKRRHLGNGDSYVILKNYFDEHELRELLEPRFEIMELVYKEYYWSVVMKIKH
jgi:multimeric flavodoxin WrbA/ubiquinone/menaquinone biosynthesis C-methylase UbiE